MTFLCVSSAQASEQLDLPNQIKEGANHPRWLRLLQYQPLAFGGFESRIDNKEFFFAPNGKTNPVDEIQATIDAFQHSKIHHGAINQPAACAFPARRKFVVETLRIEVPEVHCPEYDEWKYGINAHSVTLIFASAYANNPASMFGHTFLKLNRNTVSEEPGAQLFDYGVNFAASVPAAEYKGLFYAWKALFGGYPGVFSVMPYYMKITEYAAMESRNLWEYELNFTTDETNWLIDNLWELFGSAQIDD